MKRTRTQHGIGSTVGTQARQATTSTAKTGIDGKTKTTTRAKTTGCGFTEEGTTF